jgi:aspartyl-tRNA(Asn)/glutamyl-tRNA(Gln) amidotransferase subunit A
MRKVGMRSAIETAEAVRRRQVSAQEVLEEALGRIEAANAKLNAFVHLDPEGARRAARQVDAALARGQDPGPLAGVPFGVKDLEDCAGMPTSRGSLLYKGRPPVAEDSVHVSRLRAAGAVPVGKTAAPEFGTVAFTSTRAWGTTRNPWDPSRTPGGSSGGSAAAVAAGLVPFCTASDGGGSTRIPASFCGLFGFKPTLGRIPDPGLGPSQTSCLGALTTTVADSARHLDVAAGPDDRDRTSAPAPSLSYERAAETLDVAGLRAAWSEDLGFAVVEPEVAALARQAAQALVAAAGLQLVELPVRLTDPVRTWLACGAADLWTDLEPGMYPERADELEPLTRAILELTSGITVPRFAEALGWRLRLEQEVAALFRQVDVLLTPATAVAAFAAEGPMPTEIAGRPVEPAMAVPFTMLSNLCWNPAASVPAGLTASGLPVGLQIACRRHCDEVVLRLARIYEQARPWPRHAPLAQRL